MDDTLKLVIASTGIIGPGLITAYLTDTWNAEWVLFLGGIILTGGLLYTVTKLGYLHSVTAKLESTASDSTLDRVNDLDQLWDDLIEWEADEPRVTELKWNPQTLDATTIPLPPNNPEFFLCSIMAPTKDTDEDLHVVIETTTGYIVHHVANDKDYDYDKNQPFDSVPFVQEFRLAMMMDVMERKEMKNRFKRMASGQLPGGYEVTPLDRDTEQTIREETDGEWRRSPDAADAAELEDGADDGGH